MALGFRVWASGFRGSFLRAKVFRGSVLRAKVFSQGLRVARRAYGV